MGRGKRQGLQLALSDSQRRRRLPLIGTPPTTPAGREWLTKALIDQLDLASNHSFAAGAPMEMDRYPFFLTAPDFKGEPFCALDRSFPDLVEAQRFYVARLGDEDDPNPLPQLMLDLEDESPRFIVLGWHPRGFDLTGGDEIAFRPDSDARAVYAELEELADRFS